MEETQQLVNSIIEGIQDKKGHGIIVADLRKIEGAVCKYFVICQGGSPMQVQAIAESVEDFAREKEGEKPVHVAGVDNALWIAMDYSDVMVHIFQPEQRKYYDIEGLWKDAPMQAVPDID